ncbi:Glycoside hydrolase family 16 [Macrophomina phaseolina MS6]|uniref:chitinase n=2 Tax=Macrophomina phaseolina TaxID=35725 RepID=K2R3C1_MACPH|nr:Glycoside hydrolase family 16 [Macrophomina phaseolina MS6]KAH7063329.1 concanavalin A-like lectin/glucanase domain-containing protein [Macrophomina phaseolina]
MYFPRSCALVALATSLLPQALAQTWTSCNPLNQTDCPNNPALSTNATFHWNKTRTDSDLWNSTAGDVDFTTTGGEFTINGQGDSVSIMSNFFIFFGRVEVVMKSSKGQGIVSSIVLQSEDLDEIDIEWIGGNNTHWQSNYFGKGNTTTYDRAIWHPIDDPQNRFHNYTIEWTQEKLEWWVDDELIRTLKYEDANGGDNFPQTPMNLRLGNWPGGDPDANNQGTVEWAGGEVIWDDAPFTMIIRDVYIEDYSEGKEYKWGDTTGSYKSIETINGTSAAYEELYGVHGVSGHWAALSASTRGGIVAGAIGGFAVACGAFIFFCLKLRKQGAKAHKLEDDNWQKEQEELLEYKSQYQRMRGDSSDVHR